MRIINLIEDTRGSRACLFEHGLSFYVETAGHRLLIDAGATDAFLKNAEGLGVDIRQADLLFISHGHYDHTGGVLEFARRNPGARILMRRPAAEEYYHRKGDGFRYIGIPEEVRGLSRIELTGGDERIDEEIFIFGGVRGRKLWPSGNRELRVKRDGEFFQDEFEHEQYLVIEEGEKRVLFSGCAHNGILNILDRYRELYGSDPDAVVSGFHMQRKSSYTKEDEELVRATGRELKRLRTKFYTGHCTGEVPYRILKECMGEQLDYVHSGDEIGI